MDDPLRDELTSINSIYGEGTLVLIDEEARICTMRLPSCTSIVLRIDFPENYPEVPPSILGTQSIGSNAPKGAGKHLVDLMREVLTHIYRPGESCIFDLIEEAGSKIDTDTQLHSMETGREDLAQTESSSAEAKIDLGQEPPWTIAPALTEKKSIFLARAAPVSSPSQAKQFLQHLLATDKRAAKATHNIVAWRIRGTHGTSFQDCDDDGETAAGSRMLHLMQLMDVWDVMVVVTRWYGGVLLGPDRFRIINNAAREALQLAGYTKEGTKK